MLTKQLLGTARDSNAGPAGIHGFGHDFPFRHASDESKIGHPKSSELHVPSDRPRSQETTALRPGLSPSCPRDGVMPPEKRSRPEALYSKTWPDVRALNCRATAPPGSAVTVAP